MTPSSPALGCPSLGPHVHVRRRVNANGALAKSRVARSIPISDATIERYVEYMHERSQLAGSVDCDFLSVNLYRPPVGNPMRYDNTKQLFNRISDRVGFVVRPHTLRHSAATNWIRNDVPRDVVQNLLGHVSSSSMDVYLHASDADKRAAVDRVAEAYGR